MNLLISTIQLNFDTEVSRILLIAIHTINLFDAAIFSSTMHCKDTIFYK